MIYFVIAFFSAFGTNFLFWGFVGILRYVWERVFGRQRLRMAYERGNRHTIELRQVAVLVPAHNEELVIQETIASLKNCVLPEQIFIVSDGSDDSTVSLAKAEGCNVLDIQPSKGKAGALEYALAYFHIFDRFELALIVDADTRIDSSYLIRALPFFTDPRIVSLAGYARSAWNPRSGLSLSEFLISYRSRVYHILQSFMRYGQTWGVLSLSAIIPGFASIYRTRTLQKIDMNPQGLVIEDYNMTFEVHHKKLGAIAHHPSVFATTQDPDNWHDYYRQIKRWNLGFWQTVRLHGMWPGLFWVAESIFLGEMLLANFFILLSPFILLASVFALAGIPFFLNFFTNFLFWPQERVTFWTVITAIILADYLLTLLVAAVTRRWKMLIYGLAYIALRWVDAFVFFYTFFQGFFVRSDGKWKSPRRRAERVS